MGIARRYVGESGRLLRGRGLRAKKRFHAKARRRKEHISRSELGMYAISPILELGPNNTLEIAQATPEPGTLGRDPSSLGFRLLPGVRLATNGGRHSVPLPSRESRLAEELTLTARMCPQFDTTHPEIQPGPS
jgi:hypothetical protein